MNEEAENHMSKFIPEELIVEILKRLPPGPLMRFRCVCKSWRRFIVSPSFITAHLDHTLKTGSHRSYLVSKGCFTPTYSLYSDDVTLGEYAFGEFALLQHPLGKKEYIYEENIVGTVNGLVCWRYWTDDLNGSTYDDLVLLNPLIQKAFALPRSMDSDINSYGSLVCGFGFDSVNEDYKVIKIVYNSGEPLGSAYLFSLQRRSWKALETKPPKASPDRNRKVTFKGNVYWLSLYISGPIVVFDMVAEDFKEIMLPNCLANNYYLSIRICGDFLCLIDRKDKIFGSLDLWFMQENGMQESWVKRFSINVASIGYVREFAGFTHRGELLMVTTHHLIPYNMEKKEFTFTKLEGHLRCCKFLPYVGSLVLADIGRGFPSSFGTQDEG